MEAGRALRISADASGEPWSPSASAKDEKDGSRTPETPAEQQNRGNTPIGAVVGGVLGGLTVLLILGGILWRRCRCREPSGEKIPVGKKRWRRSASSFEIDVVDQSNQSGALGTYHPMADPVRAGAEMTPDSAENRITPLPAPWPGDMVSYSNRSSGKMSSPSSTQHPQSFAPGSVYTSQGSQHSYPPKSPFADPPGMALSPATPTGGHFFPPSPVKGAPTPPRPTVVTEAEDAGRVVEEQVPPRYNPAWAEEDGPRR